MSYFRAGFVACWIILFNTDRVLAKLPLMRVPGGLSRRR
jgi:hypothetical protein